MGTLTPKTAKSLCQRSANLKPHKFIYAVILGMTFCLPPLVFSQDTLTVMTYNIHHAEGMDGVVNENRIAEIIKEVDPDFVALQEVDSGTVRSFRTDQPGAIAHLSNRVAYFGHNLNFQGGGYGNVILTRDSVSAWDNVFLPSRYQGEQRGVMYVRTDVNGRKLLFLATHLDYRSKDEERLASVAMIDSLIDALKISNVILAGDLNDIPESETVRRIRQNIGLQAVQRAGGQKTVFTFPADSATKKIDYIFTSGDFQCIGYAVLHEPVASDHLPVVTRIMLP